MRSVAALAFLVVKANDELGSLCMGGTAHGRFFQEEGLSEPGGTWERSVVKEMEPRFLQWPREASLAHVICMWGRCPDSRQLTVNVGQKNCKRQAVRHFSDSLSLVKQPR